MRPKSPICRQDCQRRRAVAERRGQHGLLKAQRKGTNRDSLSANACGTLLVEGAAGGVGTVAVQLAAARGATVVSTASARNHEFIASLGAAPTTYGPGLAERVSVVAPNGVDVVLDCAGSGSLPDLVALVGSPDRVVTVADLNVAAYGVHLSRSGGPGADAQAIGDSPSPPAWPSRDGLQYRSQPPLPCRKPPPPTG